MFRVLHLALSLVALQAGGCIRYQRYEPAPLDPARQADVYAGRRLDDPGLARFLADHGAAPADSGVSPTALALATLYFRSEISEGRASVLAARAGQITAGTRPQPSATTTLERASPADASSADEGGRSPWTVSLTTGLTFETGGKRAARVARARAVTLTAGLRLQATAWQLAHDARRAAVASIGAERALADVEAETAALRTLLELLRARYAEGRLSLADIAQAETDVQTAAVAVTQARRARTDARAALARALAVPLPRVLQVPLRAEARSACDMVDSLPSDRSDTISDTIVTVALRRRYDLGAALADYAVAEADYRLQVAQQYPDLTIGPGIAWDQGVRRWLLSVGTPALPVARNRGPIAEAQARRAVQAARVALVEDSVLAAVDSAVAGCRDLQGEVAAADSLVAATAERVRLAEATYRRGEVGQTEVAFARLALVRATRTRRQAVQRRQAAGVALDAAAGGWLVDPTVRWPELLEPPAGTGAREEDRR